MAVGDAPDEFVSEYSVPRIITQYQGLLLSTRDYYSVPGIIRISGIIAQYQGLFGITWELSVSRLDDHAQHYELSVMAETKKMQTCQASMLRMSEKFVEPSKNVSSVARKILGGLLRGSGAYSPRKILKIMYPRLAKLHFMAHLLLKLSVI